MSWLQGKKTDDTELLIMRYLTKWREKQQQMGFEQSTPLLGWIGGEKRILVPVQLYVKMLPSTHVLLKNTGEKKTSKPFFLKKNIKANNFSKQDPN